MDDEHTFSATLRKEGPLYLVDVPPRVTKAIGKGAGRVPVVATARGAPPVQSTLVPRGGGAHKLFLNGNTRRAAGVALGEKVHVSVRFDDDPREVDVPRDLLEALDEANVREAFDKYPNGHKRHILDWIEEVKSDEARARRIAKAIENVVAKHEQRMDKAARR